MQIRKGFSDKKNSAKALGEVIEMIDQPNISAVILFLSSKLDLATVGKQIEAAFDAPIIACTTAGELSPLGYPDGSISAVSMASDKMEVNVHYIDNVSQFSADEAAEIAKEVESNLASKNMAGGGYSTFGLLLIDGLSVSEESVVAQIYGALENISIVGGSAGDDLAFKETFIYANGEFVSGGAAFASFCTSLPFKTFKTQHFIPDEDKKMVVTSADVERRIVTEINGLPAASEYARLVNLELTELKPSIFSAHPVMLRIGGEYYVRSIQKVNDDGSLTFYCAIDEGLVLTLAKGVDLIENLEATFKSVRDTIPEPQLIIGCECILRRLEILEKNLQEEAASLMNNNNVIGFHTYGEQYNGLHVNQTFTGIAIGA